LACASGTYTNWTGVGERVRVRGERRKERDREKQRERQRETEGNRGKQRETERNRERERKGEREGGKEGENFRWRPLWQQPPHQRRISSVPASDRTQYKTRDAASSPHLMA
jgi:hypothetical protein